MEGQVDDIQSRVMSWVGKVPDEHRDFEVPKDQVLTSGIKPELLAKLDANGLPSRVVDGTKHYDGFDLSNISLHMSLPSLQKMAMRCWKSALHMADGADELSFRLEYKIEPNELKKGNGPLRVLIPFEGRKDAAPSELVWSGTFVRATRPLLLPTEVADLLHSTLEGVKFYMLREGLRWQTSFIEKTKLAECGGASKLLCLKASARDIQARQLFGLILAQPYAAPHFWTEFMIDGEWIAADPMLLRVLHMSSGLSPETWPEHRSPGAVLLPLSEVIGYEPEMGRPILQGLESEAFRIDPIVTQNERDVTASFPLKTST